MDGHVIGQGQFSSPKGRDRGDSAAPTEENSLCVVQFAAIAFSWAPVHAPSQPWPVERVVYQPRYCLGCLGVHGHDVLFERTIRGWESLQRSVSYCRHCGQEVKYG
jgi:hypothetical protein